MLQSTPCLLAINNYFYARGGAEVLFLEQNRMFEQMGWQVVPLAMRHPKNLPTPWAEFFPDEIELGHEYSLARKLLQAQRVVYSLQARRNLLNLLDRVRPNIAHAHNIYHHLFPSILPVLHGRGIPTVMTVHDLKLACPAYTMMAYNQPCERCRGGKIHNVVRHRCIKGSLALSSLVMVETAAHRLSRVYERNVERFIAPSRFMLERLVEWGWPRERFTYIPNFVDLERFRPASEIGSRFVYCGRLENLKGVATFLRAAAAAKQPVTLAGTGPHETGLRALAQQLGADAIFLGQQCKQALVTVIASARAIVVPSECLENAPLALLEAYAAGRPVIGSRIAGIPELIREDETGALVAPGDVEGLASVLDRFAALPNHRMAAMGTAGRQWAEQEFSARSYRNRLLALYDSLPARVS
jgi:glycosyltransferase involved in cell wall biosynthesis